jgi:hypothetical protein
LTPDGICEIFASWDGDSCLSDCSDECDGCDDTEFEEVMGMVDCCTECLANDNCEEMFGNDCSELDNQTDCENDGCSWDGSMCYDDEGGGDEGLEILINGQESLSITQGTDITITIQFAEGTNSALLEFGYDMDGDNSWDDNKAELVPSAN